MPVVRRKAEGDTEKSEGLHCRAGDRNFSLVASRPRAHGSSGFTLLEVMVAVAILAMVLVTLLGVKNRSMQDVLLADHMTTATLLAKRTMAEMLQQNRAQEGEEEGEYPEDEFKDYKWKKTITFVSFQYENVPVTISEFRVAVAWNEGAHQETVELVSYE
jgi:general secretion pathway protein I